MVDTKDLKSFGQKCPCEFESRFEHTIVILLSRHVTSVTRRLFVYRVVLKILFLESCYREM